jgi:hypothetical protein
MQDQMEAGEAIDMHIPPIMQTVYDAIFKRLVT